MILIDLRFTTNTLLPSGSDIVSQCGLVVRDAFAADHADPPSHSVGHHTCMDGCHTHRRGLQNERKDEMRLRYAGYALFYFHYNKLKPIISPHI